MTRTTGFRFLINAVLFLLLATPALAQDGQHEMSAEEKAMMEAYEKAGTPGKQHKMLAERVGEYEVTAKSYNSPDAPPMVEKGTAKRTMIMGGRIMVETYSGSMMGTPFTGQGMTGYDNVSGKWWSTWNDSMSTGIMVSNGTCDENMACTFTGSWNDPITQGPITARMTSRPEGKDGEVMEMYAPGPDGKEVKMMELTYKKK